MAGEIIRPTALPDRPSPVASEKIPVDNGSTVGGATIAKIVEIGRPAASQLEAETGTDPIKAMTPLTTAQAIAAQGDVRFASAAQGTAADSAVQPGDLAPVATSGAYADLTGKPVIPPGLVDGNKGDVSVSSSGTSWQLNAGSVGSAELANGAVSEEKLGDGSATTAKVGPQAITDAKVNDNADIFSGKLGHQRNADPEFQRRSIYTVLNEAPIVLSEVIGTGGSLGQDASARINKAFSKLPANGGRIIIPPGDWQVGSEILNTSKRVIWEWAPGATLWVSSALNDVFQTRTRAADGTQFLNPDIRTLPGLVKTNGAFIQFGGPTENDYTFRTLVEGGFFEGAYIGIASARQWMQTIRKNQFYNIQRRSVAPGSCGIIYYEGYSHHLTIEDNFMQNFEDQPSTPATRSDPNTMPNYGIRLIHADVVNIRGNSIIRCGRAIRIDPGDGQFVAICSINNLNNLDTSECSVDVAPQGTGEVTRLHVTGNWASVQSDVGIKLVAEGSSRIYDTIINDNFTIACTIGIYAKGAGIINTTRHHPKHGGNVTNEVIDATATGFTAT